MPNAVRDNTQQHRFELDAEGHVAFSNYKRDAGTLTVLHTEVPQELNGKGIGSALVRDQLYSADSMAWSFAARKQGRNQNCWREAQAFVAKIATMPTQTAWNF